MRPYILLLSVTLFVAVPTKLLAQNVAKLTLSKGVVEAGDSVVIGLSVEPAPSYSGVIRIGFNPPNGSTNPPITSGVQIRQGEREVSLTLVVPADTLSGIYQLSYVQFGLSRTTDLTFAPTSLQVLAGKNLVGPKEAKVSLNLTQKQYLQTQSDELQHLREKVVARLSRDATRTPSTDSFLIQAIEEADRLLLQAKVGYVSLFSGSQNRIPPFFEDFDRNYRALIIDLRAESQRQSKRMLSDNGKLVLSALSAHTILYTQGSNQSSLSGSLPPNASTTIDWLTRNIRAYLKVAEDGSDEFSISFSSTPSGASISYMRTGEPYKDMADRTDINDLKFPLAMWTFKFSKPGCEPGFVRPDPYMEDAKSYEVRLGCRTK